MVYTNDVFSVPTMLHLFRMFNTDLSDDITECALHNPQLFRVVVLRDIFVRDKTIAILPTHITLALRVSGVLATSCRYLRRHLFIYSLLTQIHHATLNRFFQQPFPWLMYNGRKQQLLPLWRRLHVLTRGMRHSVATCSILLLMLLFMSACGPEEGASDTISMKAQTVEIAAAYQAAHNLDDARSALDQLEVANANQWLILTTEAAIREQGNQAETSALVALTMDLGLRSNMISSFATEHNLIVQQAGANNLAVGGRQPADTTAPETANVPGDSALANNVAAVIVPLPVDSPNNSADAPVAGNAELNTVVTSPAAAPPESSDGQAAAVETTDTAQLGAQENATVADATETPVPPAAPDTQPMVVVSTGLNMRSGPGIDYAVIGALSAGDSAQILGKNEAGNWWQVQGSDGSQGWLYGPLVQTSGDTAAVAVVLNIPTPPPTAVPVPTEPSAPAEPVASAPTPVPAGPDFRVVEKRLWDVEENGGRLDGPSVTCGEKRQLIVNLIDAAGNRINGVAVQAIYGAQEVIVSGSQGKGDGISEFVLGGGQALKVIRDADGRDVSSEEVYGLSTKPWEIPFETLIGGRFCTDDASCQSFVDATGCYGHYSWTVTFQRAY
ncbi:MAG: SH3 domain-containing protein [Caldilineaceae bacterium]